MNGLLTSRLTTARNLLQEVESKIMQVSSAPMLSKVETPLLGAAEAHRNIQIWQDILHARGGAWEAMEAIPDREEMRFGAVRLAYPIARLILVSAYLTSYWSLSDQITAWAGQILCMKNDNCHPGRKAKLTSHFTGGKARKNSGAGSALIIESITPIFGWPVALLYVLRNQFVHEGGSIDGNSIFLGEQPQDGYLLAKEGWAKVKTSAEQKDDGAKPDQHRMISPPWMDEEQPDLLGILRDCEREMDDVLGILVGSASHLLAAQVTFLLGEDN